jgi:hypothetical protein
MAKTLNYKDINLIAAQSRKQKIASEQKTVAIRQPVLILVMVLLLLGAFYYYLFTQTNTLAAEKESLTLYLEDPTTIEDFNDSIRLEETATGMVARKDELARVLLNLSSFPDMQGSDFHLIYEYAEGRIEIHGISYDRSTGVLSFKAQSKTVTGVPIFVSQLRASAIFSDIKYEGYTEQIMTFTEELAPKKEPRLDEYGNHVVNPQTGEFVYDLVPQSRSYMENAYVFALTALVKAPKPHLPGPGESLYGGGY